MEIINRIKSLDKEGRRQLARAMQTDPRVWNAVNGVGNIDENLVPGTIKGLVVNGDEIITEANVCVTPSSEPISTTPKGSKIGTSIIIPENPIASTVSSIRGEYELNLPVGKYNIYFYKDGLTTVATADIEVISETETLFIGRFGS